MKKIIVLLLTLSMLFALTACAGNDESTPTGESTGETTSTGAESTNNTTDGTEDSAQGTTDGTTGSETKDTTEPYTSTPPTITPPTTTPPTTEAPHTHNYSAATCTTPAKCSCGATKGSALEHKFVKGVCSNCNEKAKTQQIKITTENWNQYFEVRIINNAKKNNFGDYGTPKDFSITFKLFLKDEYIQKLSSIDVSIELSYDDYVESYSYDSSTGNYTLTGEQSCFMEKYTHICNFTDNDDNYRNGCYFSSGCWGGGNETTGYVTRYAKNITASRVIGTLALLSE